MITIKDTERSSVYRAFDGQIHKRYRGHHARQRLENEVRALEHLRVSNCPFVPQLIAVDRSDLQITQSDCGAAVQQMVDWRMHELFESLRNYGIEHGDRAQRNITYRAIDGIFCVVDFELATILEASWSGSLQSIQNKLDLALSDHP